MIQSITSQGLVLYNRNFREDDKLVKIFTEQAGKRMFFVKHAGQSKLAPVIQPLVLARFLLRINDDGLSYIEDYHEVMTFPKINSDLFVMAYATYVAALADASLQDNQQDAPLFAFLRKTLELMEAGIDYQVLTNIFEIQILTRFGISLNFNECAFCHRVGQAFDFSLNMEPAFAQSIIMKMRDVVILIPISLISSINFKPLILKPWRPFRLRPKSSKSYANLWINSTKSTLGFT